MWRLGFQDVSQFGGTKTSGEHIEARHDRAAKLVPAKGNGGVCDAGKEFEAVALEEQASRCHIAGVRYV